MTNQTSNAIRASEIFTPGGFPTYTYYPRDQRGLETSLKRFIENRYKMVIITGKTKSGKSVLTEKILPKDQYIWVPCGEVQSELEFWDKIVEKAGLITNLTSKDSIAEGEKLNASSTGGINIGIARVGGSVAGEDSVTKTQERTVEQKYSNKTTALSGIRSRKEPIVIDDFHYLSLDTQKVIIRSLKEVIYGGIPIVILAVPNHTYDTISAEPEMTGRVYHIEVPNWQCEELLEIGNTGFDLLNLEVNQKIKISLAKESYGSPQLMQEYCLALCNINEIIVKPDEKISIGYKGAKDGFFREVINLIGYKPLFEKVLRGPSSKGTKRTIYSFKDGSEGDIYRVILRAISQLNPKTEISYDELREAIKDIIHGTSTPPKKSQIAQTLVRISKLSTSSFNKDPLLIWNIEDQKISIIDTYLLSYIRWNA